MSKNRVTDEEMSALIDAYSQTLKDKSGGIAQSAKFKLCIIFSNIYVVVTVVLYILLRENILPVQNQEFLNESYLAVFDGRAYAILSLLTAMHASLYFNLGFRIVAICTLVYVVNSAVDMFLLHPSISNFSETPYFSVFIFTMPLFILTIALSLLFYKDDDSTD